MTQYLDPINDPDNSDYSEVEVCHHCQELIYPGSEHHYDGWFWHHQCLPIRHDLDVHPKMNDDEISAMLTELYYRSYRQQRILFPHVAPEKWELIFGSTMLMEKKYQSECK